MKNMFHVPLYMELHTIERAALSTGIHVGGERCFPWWLIMWPSSFSPPTSWREAADTLGGMFSDCLLLDFLYPKMFFLPLQTCSHSSAAACPQSSSCYSFFFFLTSMIYLFCFLCIHLRSSSFPDIKFLFFCHSAEPSVVGPRTCWGKHCTSLLDTFFKDYAWCGVSGRLHHSPLWSSFWEPHLTVSLLSSGSQVVSAPDTFMQSTSTGRGLLTK